MKSKVFSPIYYLIGLFKPIQNKITEDTKGKTTRKEILR